MDLITKQEVAAKLGVTVRTVDNLVYRGELPAPKHIGRRVYWIKEEFDRYLRQCLSV